MILGMVAKVACVADANNRRFTRDFPSALQATKGVVQRNYVIQFQSCKI